ncbi:MAG TPA: hypothetical protein VF733_04125 [Candidatus Saccharimonadales bacterium]
MASSLEITGDIYDTPPLPPCLYDEPTYSDIHEQWAAELYQQATTPLQRLEALAEMSLPHAWRTILDNRGDASRTFLITQQVGRDATAKQLWQDIMFAEFTDSPLISLEWMALEVASEFPERFDYLPRVRDREPLQQNPVDVNGGPVARAIPDEYYALQAAYNAGREQAAAEGHGDSEKEIVKAAGTLLLVATEWQPGPGEYLDAITWAQLGSQVGNTLLELRSAQPETQIDVQYFANKSDDVSTYDSHMALLKRIRLPKEERIAAGRADLERALAATIEELATEDTPAVRSRLAKLQNLLSTDEGVVAFVEQSYQNIKNKFFDTATPGHKAALLGFWMRPIFRTEDGEEMKRARVPWTSGKVSEALINETFERYRYPEGGNYDGNDDAGTIEYDALIKYIFGDDTNPDRSLQYNLSFCPSELIDDVIKVKRVVDKSGEQLAPPELLTLAVIVDGKSDRLDSLLGMGYHAADLIKTPLLGLTLPYGPVKDICPLGGSNKNRWFADHALEYLHGGWNRATIGNIIAMRAHSKAYEKAAFTSDVLKIFQVPIEYAGKRLHDTELEEQYLAQLLATTPQDQGRLRLTGKQNQVEQLFWNVEHQYIYKSLLAVMAEQGISPTDSLRNFIKANQADFFDQLTDSNNPRTTERIVRSVFYARLQKATESVLQHLQDQVTPSLGDIHATLHQLKTLGVDRQAYIKDTSSWLLKHAGTPDWKLLLAWSVRGQALEAGVQDTSDAILEWYQPRQMDLVFNDEVVPGTSWTNAELRQRYSHWIQELSRHYSAPEMLDIIKSCALTKKEPAMLPALRVQLQVDGATFVGAILDHDNPKGATIGNDARCCMTWNRQAKECIRAGYNLPNAGFFILESDNRLVAQSLFFVSKDQPDTLVLDSIEALPGRNPQQALRLYASFWKSYLTERRAEDPDWPVTKVQIGVRYDLPIFKDLPEAKTAPTDAHIHYTDAKKQRVLLDLSDEDLATVAPLHVLPPSEHPAQSVHLTTATNKHAQIMHIEKAAFPPDFQTLTSIDEIEKIMDKPDAQEFSFVAFADGRSLDRPIGACLAYMAPSSAADEPARLVIDSFATLPGSSTEVSLRMFRELLERAKDANIQTVVFTARESTSYRLVSSESLQRRLRSWGFTVMGDSHPDNDEGERTFNVILKQLPADSLSRET